MINLELVIIKVDRKEATGGQVHGVWGGSCARKNELLEESEESKRRDEPSVLRSANYFLSMRAWQPLRETCFILSVVMSR